MTGWSNQFKQVGVFVHHLPLTAHLSRPLRFIQAQFDFAQQQRIRHFCRTLGPDIIHTNHQYDEDGLDLPLAVKEVAPHIATIHLPMCATKHQRPLGRWRGRWLRSWYRQNPFPKIFVSYQAEQEFNNYYPNCGSTFAIPNGVWRETKSSPMGKKLHYQNPFTLGFVGRLNCQKDPLLLAKTWIIVNHKLPDCRLLIVGEGEMRSELETYLQTHAPSGFWQILGWLDDPNHVQKFYAQLDLLILTSHFESAVPLVLMEAAVTGIPSIALSIPEYLEFQLHVPIMQLVTERNPQTLARAIIQEYHQQQLIKALTPQTLESIRNYFSISRMANLTIEAYNDAIANFLQSSALS
jgi:glycosyltransferase involved in cell wall biosynthesis